MTEVDEEEIKKAFIEAEVKLMQENRINFSKQADDVIERIKKGEKPRDSDYFILFNTDQKKINEAIELDEIKERIKKGKIEYSDVDFLISTLGGVGEFDLALRKAFYKRADEMNLNYALNHKDKFTDEEIQERRKKVEEHQTLTEIIEENLL